MDFGLRYINRISAQARVKADIPTARMQTWFIFTRGAFMPKEVWEHLLFNGAVAAKLNMVEYTWSSDDWGEITHTTYKVDLVRMTQTNTETGTVRPLLYFPHNTSQSVTSPFYCDLPHNTSQSRSSSTCPLAYTPDEVSCVLRYRA